MTACDAAGFTKAASLVVALTPLTATCPCGWTGTHLPGWERTMKNTSGDGTCPACEGHDVELTPPVGL